MKTHHLTCIALIMLAPAVFAAQPGSVVENSLGMKLAYVPAGSFTMGSGWNARRRMPDELPHAVEITKPFRIGTTEVTQAQYRAVMDASPSRFVGDDRPVEMVSWKDAVAFCKKLSEKEGKTYRLPTEAEWEYACRAGGGRRRGRLGERAWYYTNSAGVTHPVAQKQANAWGLYDMLGNVAEWCSDFYGPYPDEAKVSDPTGPGEGMYHVVRGGAYMHFARGCRCAARLDLPESYQLGHIGFRVVEEQ